MDEKDKLTKNIEQTADWVLVAKDTGRQKASWCELTQKQGNRNKDLFKDRYMSFFINNINKKVASSKLDKMMHLSLALRTKKFRKLISDCIKIAHVQQVLILGSGKDTLAVRKNASRGRSGITFYEIDQHKVLDEKEAVYEMERIDKNAIYIRMDYTKECFIQRLEAFNFDFTKPTFILWEGNILYLEREKILDVLQKISIKFKCAFVAFDYLHNDVLTNYQVIDARSQNQVFTKMRSAFDSCGATMKTGLNQNDICEMAVKYGFNIESTMTIGDLAKQYCVDDEPFYTSWYHHLTMYSKR